MEPRTELNGRSTLSVDAGLLPAPAAQIACLQQLVAELLVKNERLRQALAAQICVEPTDLL